MTTQTERRRSFWDLINDDLDRIETEKPRTYADVARILIGQTKDAIASETTMAPAFFAGGGGDRSLFSALSKAGWRMTWAEAYYYYVAEHPDTGDVITYCEGDVYPGDVAVR